ncbi:hypothetical protein FHR22_000253 [Sphingopyxis panaciterrae]|uniref:hypothetical protein n=1 Tax=Sphingopyxis panaciterrae TaxID=363841 RepID=UPI0014228F8C|nr:hypothetical protein [Sphingopyxis panaciterrae]NIJ35604.1 hypothetical protein [Sphingopyxis panaciterrae]
MLLPILIAAAAPVAAPAHAVVDLVANKAGQLCLSDGGICLELPADEDSDELPANLLVSFPGAGDTEKTALPLPSFSGEPQGLRLWPHLVSVRGGDDGQGLEYLVGVITEQRAMYSGGGGSGGRLHLLRFGMAPHAIALSDEVLDIEWDSSLMIRACFSEQDMEDRLGACHDEYSFTGALAAAAPGGGELPSLTYRTTATAYPQSSRRSEDNSGTKLKKSDLTKWKDPECSYTRMLHYNPATARYEMDRAAPDCSDYTTP